MKKLKIIWIVLLLIVIGYIGFNKWLDYEDNPLTQANRAHKFSNNIPYIIIKTDSSGATIEQDKPLVYAIVEPSEPKNFGGLSWRRIGLSRVDLEKYINKQVYIDGEYYEGIPLLINKPAQDQYGVTMMQPVIKINNLTLVK